MTAQNFRVVTWWSDAPSEPERMTFSEYAECNSAAPLLVESVSKLEPGATITLASGLNVKRVEKTQARYTRVRVPITFDGAGFATLLIDRRRGTMAIRPAHRRIAITIELGDWADKMLHKQATLNAIDKRKARRTRRPR